MPLCQTGHLRTHYQDIGKKDRPVILLLHGWGHSWETWASYIPTLSENYRLIIPDLPGFGQTDGSNTGWNMYQYSAWLSAFLQHCELKELHAVVGHSFGGKLLSFAWFAYGETIPLPPVKKGFFAISPSGVVRPLSALRMSLAWVLQFVPTILKRNLFGPLRSLLYSKILDETDYLVATPFQEASLRKFLSEDITQTVTTPKEYPLHFAWGKNDQAVSLWMAYKYRKISENSDVFILPEGDHFVHLTHPTMITAWLEASL